MGGFFGAAGKTDVIADLYYGTDYHSHLGTRRGGIAVARADGFSRAIHNIENAQFRSKFDAEVGRLRGSSGIGVISDTDDQPLLIRSHLGDFAIATVGVIRNAETLANDVFNRRRIHFSEMSRGELNPTELAAALINQEESIEAGIHALQNAVEGSCSLLLLTREGF
jgi:amidophosphoribosyltransferase